jgi:hypothetical protein
LSGLNPGSGGGEVIPPQPSGGGSVSTIESTDSTVTVTNAHGPTVDLTNAGGGATVSYLGFVQVTILASLGDTDRQVDVVPLASAATPAGSTAQCAPDGESWIALQAIGAGDGFSAYLTSYLEAGIFDGVDIAGNLVVWDLTGANLLQASISGGPITDLTAPYNLALTAVQTIGTDLSITGGDTITSAAGGVYNAQLTIESSWF